MKTLGWIILSVVVLVTAAALGAWYYFGNIFFKEENFKIKFKPNAGNSLSDLLGMMISADNNSQQARSSTGESPEGIGLYVDFPLKATIDNLNKVGINIQDLFLKVAYQGESFLETKPDSAALENVSIPANTKGIQLADTVKILVNTKTIQLVRELIRGNKPEVDISVQGKSLGIKTKQTFKYPLDFSNI